VAQADEGAVLQDGAVSAEVSRSGARQGTLLVAAQLDDEAGFTLLVERHRRALQVHCYRMLGSLEDAEDLVQETFLRAWRKRSSFTYGGDPSLRAWLYRIATNACLDALERLPRRVLPSQLSPPAHLLKSLSPPADLPWLQPYPDRLLDEAASDDTDPGETIVSKETIELAFIAAIQLLPPRQRAVLIVRDVLGWSANDAASLLEASVAAVNSALQRARATLRDHVPPGRLEWAADPNPSEQERGLLRRYMDAFERGDAVALANLLREDARLIMPPYREWFEGREVIITFLSPYIDPRSPDYMGRLRFVPSRANRQPAVAFYLRRPGEAEFRALVLDLLRVEDGLVTEIVTFNPNLFPAFGLPRGLSGRRLAGDVVPQS
jgi:RNA polymerase sigma-70 factor (ECF subfamily)